MQHRLAKYFTIIGLIIGLIACSSKPDDSVAFAYITKNDSLDGVYKVANLVRKNGWPEGENIYKVEYTYDWVAQMDYSDYVLETVKEIEGDKTTFPEGLMGMGWVTEFSVAMSDSDKDNSGLFNGIARANMEQTDDGARKIRIGKRLRTSPLPPKLDTYLQQGHPGAPVEKNYRLRNLLYAMAHVESNSYVETTKAGDAIQNRTWSLLFAKSENGWIVKP